MISVGFITAAIATVAAGRQVSNFDDVSAAITAAVKRGAWLEIGGESY